MSRTETEIAGLQQEQWRWTGNEETLIEKIHIAFDSTGIQTLNLTRITRKRIELAEKQTEDRNLRITRKSCGVKPKS
jgi:hypothetical protein